MTSAGGPNMPAIAKENSILKITNHCNQTLITAATETTSDFHLRCINRLRLIQDVVHQH
jgi:hypothetical protein